MPVSINSDDPPMFGTDLNTEYALAAETLNLDRQGMARLVLDAIEQSFAGAGIKTRLRQEVLAHTPLPDTTATQAGLLRPTAGGNDPGRPTG